MVTNRDRLYYGWYIVLSSAIIVLLSMEMRMGIDPFVNPVMEDLGFTRTTISIIIAIGMLVYGMGIFLGTSNWCSTWVISWGWGYEQFGSHLFAFGLAALLSLIASIVVYSLPQKLAFPKYLNREKNHLCPNKTFINI